jgi:hypothetical protein
VFGVTAGCHATTTGFQVESLADNAKQSMYQDYKIAYGKGGDQHKEEAESTVSLLVTVTVEGQNANPLSHRRVKAPLQKHLHRVLFGLLSALCSRL